MFRIRAIALTRTKAITTRHLFSILKTELLETDVMVAHIYPDSESTRLHFNRGIILLLLFDSVTLSSMEKSREMSNKHRWNAQRVSTQKRRRCSLALPRLGTGW